MDELIKKIVKVKSGIIACYASHEGFNKEYEDKEFKNSVATIIKVIKTIQYLSLHDKVREFEYNYGIGHAKPKLLQYAKGYNNYLKEKKDKIAEMTAIDPEWRHIGISGSGYGQIEFGKTWDMIPWGDFYIAPINKFQLIATLLDDYLFYCDNHENEDEEGIKDDTRKAILRNTKLLSEVLGIRINESVARNLMYGPADGELSDQQYDNENPYFLAEILRLKLNN